MHRFDLDAISPVFNASQMVALCVGIGGIHHLPADDPKMAPFLHLALTDANQVESAKPFLIATKEQENQKAGVLEDPWNGLSFTLRADFVEVPVDSDDARTLPAEQQSAEVEEEIRAEKPLPQAEKAPRKNQFLSYP